MCKKCIKYRFQIATLVDFLTENNIKNYIDNNNLRAQLGKHIIHSKKILDEELPEIFKR